MTETAPDEFVEAVQVKNPRLGRQLRQARRATPHANGIRDVRARGVAGQIIADGRIAAEFEFLAAPARTFRVEYVLVNHNELPPSVKNSIA
jgi:hypothetical protein